MTQELDTICSVVKNKDIDVLFSDNVDDLFESYGDVWHGIKTYYNKYRAIPDQDILEKEFPDFEYVDTKGDTQYHLERLKSEHISSSIEALVMKAASKIRPETAEMVLKGLQKDLSKLNRFSHSVRDLDIMDFDEAERHYADVRERAAQMGGVPGISTGIGFIDASMVMGMQPGDMVTVIGYPARGKSALGAVLASNIYATGRKPLIISMEMPASAYRDRVYTIMGSGLFKNSELSLGIFGTDDFRNFKNKNDKSVAMPVVEGDGGPVTPNIIQAKINEHRPDVVIIDYLQLLHDNGLSQDMTARVRQLSLEIKALAVGNKIPIIVIASATPPDGGRVDGPPNVERTAWSRQPAYDASLCIAIHKHEGSNIFEVVCAKNRYGPLFAGFLDWDIDRGVMKEVFDTP